jgi:hypothetical protein
MHFQKQVITQIWQCKFNYNFSEWIFGHQDELLTITEIPKKEEKFNFSDGKGKNILI